MIVLPAILLLEGCYYMQAATGQWQVLRERQPITEVLESEQASPALKKRLQLVREARDFSIEVLLLPDNDSYRTYSDLSRDYVVWNVFAAPEFSLDPLAWCFPVAGCVNYRGYFREDKALKAAARLAQKGNDVFIGGVTAYSTLGKFSDPVLSTMLRYDDVQLVAVLFHELAHQVVYVKGDSAFNESFASAVEETGVERWLKARNAIDQLAAFKGGWLQRRDVIGLVDTARRDLTTIYASEAPIENKRQDKQHRMQRLKAEVIAYLQTSGRSPSAWETQLLNNARLIPLSLYDGWLPAFRAILDDCGGELLCFYARARALASLPFEERTAALEALL